MPGDNCAFNQCGTSRRTKGVGLFKLPTANDEESTRWRREFLNVITRYRVKDKDFVRQLSSDSIHVCEMKLPVLFPPKNTIEQRTVRFLSKEVNAIANFVLKKSVIKNNQSKGDKRDSWYQQNQKHPLP